MASAAAAKKWPRLSQAGAAVARLMDPDIRLSDGHLVGAEPPVGVGLALKFVGTFIPAAFTDRDILQAHDNIGQRLAFVVSDSSSDGGRFRQPA